MKAANAKFSLALPLTAGFDSRLILSSCKEIKDDIQIYTLQYRELTKKSPDLAIPKIISSELDLNYELLDCRKEVDKEFIDIYKENNTVSHVQDWGNIASGMHKIFDTNRVVVRGNCVEIGRGKSNNGLGNETIKVEAMLNWEYHWDELDFVVERIDEWYNEVKLPEVNKGYNLMDLFYWEHRMGKWQAQNQLEWGIVQEMFTPFNNREIIDLMLGVPHRDRTKPEYLLFRKVICRLWPELLNYPINPKPLSRRVFNSIKKITIELGFYDILRKILKG